MKNNIDTSTIWSNREKTNQVIESTKEIRVIENSLWKDTGLNKEAVALKVQSNGNNTEYFLNYYAIEAIQKSATLPWTIPSTEDWASISETQQATTFKIELIGSISPFGEKENNNFVASYWTNKLQGGSHAFVAVLTNLNDKVYLKSQAKAAGNLLRLIKTLK